MASAPSEPQVVSAVLMVRPARFGWNADTAVTNAFQRPPAGAPEDVRQSALGEFDAFASLLAGAGVEVVAVEDTAEPEKPDAVFPNNWVTFHADGTAVLYPLQAPTRRAEVRPEILAVVEQRLGVAFPRVLDLRRGAPEGCYLEGTGSLVLDRVARVAYACRSPRTHPGLLDQFARHLGYEVVAFEAVDRGGVPVYHTNVLMWIGEAVQAACLEALPRHEERDGLRRRLMASGRALVELSLAQVGQFAGNALALASVGGDALIVASRAAWASLGREQRATIERAARPVTPAIDTIEQVGGGSARCMLAEVPRPRAR